MRIISLFLTIAVLMSCGQDDEPQVIIIPGGNSDAPAAISFSGSEGSVLEGNSISILLTLDQATVATTNITIDVSSSNLVYGQQYTTAPTATNDQITLQVEEGSSTVNFQVSTLTDTNAINGMLTFKISNSSNENITIGTQDEFTLDIAGVIADNCNVDIATDYVACFDRLSDTELNIVSWNIEFFEPGKIPAVKALIESMQPDVIAVQEINVVSAFISLGNQLDGWEARVVDVSGSLDLGYLYKTCEITAFDTPTSVLNGAFEPRPAVQTKITHINGLEVTLFNIHMKCCGTTGSSAANRRAASAKVLQDHINNNLPNENVIVLGDWNDDIGDGPFDNFLADPNFSFADEAIGNGPISQWSYPGWPSHLDHILISNELSDNLVDTKTLVIDDCLSGYLHNVSDHRPVMATFSN
jgi:endonuclease/exonuclease/phosphatase family metal-dependent hydrolase